GSDLAGLTTRAIPDGEEWVVNGQKVWTSMGHTADYGMLLARTNPDVPKHQGITYFALEMHQPGVEVRPLREMTGQALFNEVFLTDARVSTSAVIGDLHGGWRVANTTLAHERAGLGAGGGGGGGSLTPGSVAGHLDKRAGDFVRADAKRPTRSGSEAPRSTRSNGADLLIGLAKGNGKVADPVIRQGLARLFALSEIGRFNAERVKAARAQGRDLPGMANIAKLSMSDLMRLNRDLGLQVLGAAGMLHGYTDDQREQVVRVTGNPFLPAVTGTALFTQGPPIYGGTDQVQRNIIGERVLGLPKEPSQDRELPFSALPKNG
ncbi:MAG: acyl-CoA dehydrogenase family protein, partial [Acidimicrobiales bacterium]